MKKNVLVLMLVMSIVAFSANIAGLEILETVERNGEELVLNGAGIRKKAFINLYVGSLYVEEKTTDENSIIEGDETVSIRLDIISGLISNSAMVEAVEEGFEDSTTPEELEALKDEIAGFISVFEDDITKGDYFTFDYSEKKGIEAYKNDELLITVEGKEFKEALYGVWLGNKPADKNLKKDMMNK